MLSCVAVQVAHRTLHMHEYSFSQEEMWGRRILGAQGNKRRKLCRVKGQCLLIAGMYFEAQSVAERHKGKP